MVQIYKSHIADLLRRPDEPIRALQLIIGADGSVSLQNVNHQEARGFLDKNGDKCLIEILNRGLDNRLMRSTDANEASSRSHLLFAVTMSHTDESTGATISGKMMFVDLAGSERLAMLGFTLYLYEEAVFINESLAVLGKIIWRLSKGYLPRQIDYDCNILTSLLKDTLGGDAKTLMFVCIGPSIMDIEATRDTLRFAQSTGKIKAMESYIDAKAAEKELPLILKE
jgi:kinesin family protein C2/C3